ncbi:sensor histidine kinase [Hamadaea tsunoensis]|uniref:sensor histidine kinase n=1 Tax=Hamadaea tsunoensis TaxID=53368 RepID=UPI000410C8A8|nr:HAMP domain-containing sensor histidine kinase [Hamadaea tsunoensis]
MTGRSADARLVRRAAWVVAAQTAAAVALVVAGIILVVLVFTVREQRTDAERIVHDAATAARDVTPEQPQIVLLESTGPGTTVESSTNAPDVLRRLDIRSLPPGRSTVRAPRTGHGDDNTEYLLYAADRGDVRMVAALDTRFRAYETRRLGTSLLIAGIAGILAAAAIGWFVGRRAVRPLAGALAMQRRFVADASHELRTPLTILHTRAQLIARRPHSGLDERTRRDIEGLRHDTQALTEIVNDLLLAAELEHRPELSEPVDLGELARQVAVGFNILAQQNSVRLTAETPAAPVVIAGVAVALRRAVNALVDNALAHTGPGDEIVIAAGLDAGAATLSVTDTGEGLDPAEADTLTERFARGGTDTGRGRRFGLGLALVREVVEAHGGGLTLTGRPGEGARAVLTFPTR